MGDQWYAIVRTSDSELVSVATVLAEPLPKDLETIPLDHPPDWSAEIWDNATKSLIPRPAPPPPKDRVDDIMADSKLVGLLSPTKDDMRQAIIANLPDDARYY